MKIFLLISFFVVLLEAKPTPARVPDLIIKHDETFLDTGLGILRNLFSGAKPTNAFNYLRLNAEDQRTAGILVNTANPPTNREDVELEEQEVKFEHEELNRDETLIFFVIGIFALFCVIVVILLIFLTGYISFLCKQKILAIEERGVEKYHYKRKLDEAMERH